MEVDRNWSERVSLSSREKLEAMERSRKIGISSLEFRLSDPFMSDAKRRRFEDRVSELRIELDVITHELSTRY